MTKPVEIAFTETDADQVAAHDGRVALIMTPEAKLPKGLPRHARDAVKRATQSEAWKALKPGAALELAFPAGMSGDALQLVMLPKNASVIEARKAGATIGAGLGHLHTLVLAGNHKRADEVALGIALRGYDFGVYQTSDKADDAKVAPRVTFMSRDPEALAKTAGAAAAVAEGVFFTRDLINEPANVLTTSDFADRLKAMEEIGLSVEVLDEDELAKLGMRALLAVGQGSESPSKVVVMRWNGGGDEAPLALVGKGVVFDTGGISIKPAAGMEDMTMDMGGAGVVAGVMRTLALRRAKANVVGLVGLVENMPDGRAQRPGDIVKSMKGDTIEVINTDAEGRLVLADVLWYAQTRFEPAAVVDLATLTGAVIIALGHDNAGVFANDDKLANNILKAADAEGEGAWRLPLAPSYDKLIKSRLADMKNTGGRAAGSITAAQFLQRFIRKDQPWAHIDIAGVALPPSATTLAPKGATGWGVMTLDRLVRDQFEAD
ncbi:leucyl aminopeptidase [Paracoccus sp. Z330]|uniref:Probable cytosol aminopeptidase n=1 Tax=Paracoccus onchidii TaxID=3017813 RepID=A0ABT4ZBD2_9RHOB|nr:leucyl aminopeptidase [Paracoccus onchidii]MDB6176570.1 leucyl aminopeptidase [Paracoccus onchidii]